jgi:hypothetical protein
VARVRDIGIEGRERGAGVGVAGVLWMVGVQVGHGEARRSKAKRSKDAKPRSNKARASAYSGSSAGPDTRDLIIRLISSPCPLVFLCLDFCSAMPPHVRTACTFK